MLLNMIPRGTNSVPWIMIESFDVRLLAAHVMDHSQNTTVTGADLGGGRLRLIIKHLS